MIEVPKGRLVENKDGPLRAELCGSRPARQEIRAWFERLEAAKPRRVLRPSELNDGPRGLTIDYGNASAASAPLGVAIAAWRLDPPATLPRLLGLGRFVLET